MFVKVMLCVCVRVRVRARARVCMMYLAMSRDDTSVDLKNDFVNTIKV